MDRILQRLRQLLGLAFTGLGYAAILALSVVRWVISGLWSSSDTTAKAWQREAGRRGVIFGNEDILYWFMRTVAFALSFVALSIIDHIITGIVIQILIWIWWRLP